MLLGSGRELALDHRTSSNCKNAVVPRELVLLDPLPSEAGQTQPLYDEKSHLTLDPRRSMDSTKLHK